MKDGTGVVREGERCVRLPLISGGHKVIMRAQIELAGALELRHVHVLSGAQGFLLSSTSKDMTHIA